MQSPNFSACFTGSLCMAVVSSLTTCHLSFFLPTTLQVSHGSLMPGHLCAFVPLLEYSLFLQLPNTCPTLLIHYWTFEFPLKHHILSSRPLDNLGSVILCSLVILPLSKQLACSLQLHTLGTSLLNQGSASYDPEAKFGPAPVFVNKVSLKHRKAH